MTFHIILNKEAKQLDLKLHNNLKDFYLAFAVVKNGKLACYASNDGNWFKEFQKNWGDDPIVSITPPIQEKLSLIEWEFSSVKSQHKSYCEYRYNITGADSGFTAFKSYLENNEIVSEFYAIGSREESSFSQSMILNPIFIKQSFRTIVPVFKKLI